MRRLASVCLLALLTAPGGARAAGDEAALVTLALEELGSAALESRESAQELLGTLEGPALAAIEAALADPGIDPERARRLAEAGAQVFARTPRGALGIQFGPIQSRGVTIERTVAGFDAERKLAANDLVLEAGGRPIVEQLDLRLEILMREPGQVLPMVIERGGERVSVEVALGDYGSLNAPPLDLATAREVWFARLERAGLDQTWRGARLSFVSGAGDAEPGTTRRAVENGVVAGGAMRRGLEGLAWTNTPPTLSVRERQLILERRRPGEDPFERPRLMQQLADLRAQHQGIARRVQLAEAELREPGVAGPRLLTLEGEAQRGRATLQGLEQQIEDLTRRLLDE